MKSDVTFDVRQLLGSLQQEKLIFSELIQFTVVSTAWKGSKRVVIRQTNTFGSGYMAETSKLMMGDMIFGEGSYGDLLAFGTESFGQCDWR